MSDPSVPPPWQPYAAPHVAPRPPAPAPPAPAAARGSGLGILALVLSAVATVGASAVGGLAAWRIALGAAKELASRPAEQGFDWSVLTPVRDWAILGETSFWAGTVVGIAAVVIGVVAIVRDRGRAPGVAALVVAALGPVLFFVGAWLAIESGFAAGSTIGG